MTSHKNIVLYEILLLLDIYNSCIYINVKKNRYKYHNITQDFLAISFKMFICNYDLLFYVHSASTAR